MNKFQDRIHVALGSSTLASKIAVKLRNQANCVIAKHMSESANSSQNGEYRLIDQLAPQVSRFVDVGANKGEWSEYLLSRGASEGVCFDPSAQCVAYLKELFESRPVEVREKALSDVSGSLPFFEEHDHGETSSLGSRTSGGAGVERIVEVSTLDAEFPDPDTKIDLLKTDCEGWDLRTLKGGREILTRTRFVQFEYNSSWLNAGSSLLEAMTFLQDLGFQVFLVRSTGLHPLRYAFWGDFFRYANFFALRESDLYVVEKLIGSEI